MQDPSHQTLAVIDRLIDRMSEAVLVITRDHQVISLNQAALDLLGLDDREAGLRSIDEYHELITSWRIGGAQADTPSELARSLSGTELRDQHVTITTSAGEERQVSFSATPASGSISPARSSKRIWAESQGPGHGATFSFALPITRA